MKQNRVLVLDRHRKPLMPCHPARARQLLKAGRAAVFRRYPFTIILHDRDRGEVQLLRLKLDPGAKVTGMAMTAAFQRGETVVLAAELHHRGEQIRQALLTRRALRRARRNRKTRYRKPRFNNRRRPEGWLPPSLVSRVENAITWVERLCRYAPVTHLSMELVRFDTQRLQDPEISGVEYQQGTLFGYEVREYLLEKWGRRCAYCDTDGVPLEIDHVIPRSKGGTDRVSNLTLACHRCNQSKSDMPVEVFLTHDPERLSRIKAQLKTPLTSAAAVNTTRWGLFRRLHATGLAMEAGSGGRTKYNRSMQRYPKRHWIDAACVGESGEQVRLDPQMQVLLIAAKGHGVRQRCRTDKYGFPNRYVPRQKKFFGFQTGDMVRAGVPKGKHRGVHVGWVAVRATGSFRVGAVDGISHRYCKVIHRADGYQYGA